MKTLPVLILEQLNATTDIVTNAKTNDLADLLESHPDFPHCERYVVDLVNVIKKTITSFNYSISKNELLNIYQRYSGVENANTLRTDDIIKHLAI